MSIKIHLSRMAPLVLLICLLLSPCIAEEPRTPNLDFFLVEEVFPHIAIGGPWSTTLTLVNVGDAVAVFPVRFFRSDGQPWAVTTSTGVTASTFNVTLGFTESVDIELLSQGSTIQTGWAEIDQPAGTTVGGHAVFRDNGGPGRPIPFEAAVPLSTFAEGDTELLPGFRTSLLPFDQTRGFNTCLALANNSQFSTTTVILLMPVPGGQPITLGPNIVLPPRNQASFCFRDRFPQTENRRGVVVIGRVEADLYLSVIGFRFDPQGAFTTFFPMSQL